MEMTLFEDVSKISDIVIKDDVVRAGMFWIELKTDVFTFIANDHFLIIPSDVYSKDWITGTSLFERSFNGVRLLELFRDVKHIIIHAKAHAMFNYYCLLILINNNKVIITIDSDAKGVNAILRFLSYTNSMRKFMGYKPDVPETIWSNIVEIRLPREARASLWEVLRADI